MGRKKRLRKRINGLKNQHKIHEEKSDKESRKEKPDKNLINYWESEKKEFEKQIEKAEMMLNRKKRKQNS